MNFINNSKQNFKRKIKNNKNLKLFVKGYSLVKNNIKNKQNLNNLKNNNLISVIMLLNGNKKEILESINSVLNQSLDNFELIIIDNNEKDFIKKEYSNYINLNKIRYYPLDYNNESQARNFALKKSKGNLIAYLDSNYKWSYNFFEIMLTNLKDNRCVYCKVSNKEKKFNRKDLLNKNFINLNSFMHEKSLFYDLMGFNEDFETVSPWDLIIRYTKENNPIYVNKRLVKEIVKDNVKYCEDEIEKIHQRYWTELYENEIELVKDYFNQEYYLNHYKSDVKNLNPLYHFLSRGYLENKNPNQYFSTKFYKNHYEDVYKSNINPLIHYVKVGKQKNRQTNYYKEKEKILEKNLFYLSNYTFSDEPLVSIIILNRNGIDYLKILFNDFSLNANYSNFEIIVVDNDSDDGSVEYLQNLDLNIKLIENKENVSFSKGNNDAVNIANGEYILFLNNDIEPTYGWLNEMMGTILFNDNVGVVGAKLVYPYIGEFKKEKFSFSMQHFGGVIRKITNLHNEFNYGAFHKNKFNKNIFDNQFLNNEKEFICTAACLLIKKEIFFKINRFDESYNYGLEDVDLSIKLFLNDYKINIASSALLFHHESATRKKENINNSIILHKKWDDILFKLILKDKIENNNFISDEKLNIVFIFNKKYNNGSFEFINNSITYFNEHDYKTNFNYDNINGKTDIIISFDQNVNLNINPNKSIIKILVLVDDDMKTSINSSEYDFIIVNDNKLKDFVLDDTVVYSIEDLNKLGEEIILMLYQHYLKEDYDKYLTILNSEYFDMYWYSKQYNIPIDGLNPALHYLKHGYKKGFNPSSSFSTNQYYYCNNDVKRKNINPLLHYELFGRDENRQIKYLNEDILDESTYSISENSYLRDLNKKLNNELEITKNNSKFFNFEEFLSYAYNNPIIRSPYSQIDKKCFEFMDYIGYYLRNIINMDNKPLVSIIIPTYNRIDLLKKAIESVLNQTYDNFELIISDDGSSDNTVNYVNSIEDVRIKLITQEENKGVSHARNSALKIAKGEYIAYLDSDNVWEPEYIETMIGAFIKLSDADAIYSGQKLFRNFNDEEYGVRFGSYNKMLLHNRNYIDINCFCHKRDVYTKFGGFREDFMKLEDWDFILKVSNNCKVYSVPVLLSKYYNHDLEDRISNRETGNYMDKLMENNKLTFKKAYKINKKISVILLNLNSSNYDLDEINKILLLKNNSHVEIIVVDDNSNEDITKNLKSLNNDGEIKLISIKNEFEMNNAIIQGINLSDEDADILILKNNVSIGEYALEHLQNFMFLFNDCGMVVPHEIALSNNESIKNHVPYAFKNYPCDILPSNVYKNIINMPIFHDGTILELNYAPFICTYIKREVINEFLSKNIQIKSNLDIILCEFIMNILKMKIYQCPDAFVYHK